MTDTFKVDNYGNTDVVKEIATTGVMGSHRIGDMLPFNYLPPADNWWDSISQKEGNNEQ